MRLEELLLPLAFERFSEHYFAKRSFAIVRPTNPVEGILTRDANRVAARSMRVHSRLKLLQPGVPRRRPGGGILRASSVSARRR